MSPDRLATLRTFFSNLETRLPGAVALTYLRLFEADPEADSLFNRNIRDEQRRFAGELQDIVKLTRSSQLWPAGAPTGQILIPEVAEFGRRCAEAGLTIQHFTIMKRAMARACEEIAPADFTPPVAEALAFILDVLVQSLCLPSDSAAKALSKLPCRTTATVLHDPFAYFDEELPGVSTA